MPADYPQHRSAADYLPQIHTYKSLCKAASGCRGCDLYKNATQTVFGEGSMNPNLMLIGEQPGDVEDKAGHPFVGPAGALLTKALNAANISADTVYTTNAVKHFKWTPTTGKRRLHKKPSAREVAACKPWLEEELALLKPKAIVCLGSTAAQSLLGPKFSLMKHMGEWQTTPTNLHILATYHPSAVLRAPDHASRKKLFDTLVNSFRLSAS